MQFTFAGIHINSVTRIANVQIPDHDICTAGGVSSPRSVVCNGKPFPTEVCAGDGFKDRLGTGIERFLKGRCILCRAIAGCPKIPHIEGEFWPCRACSK